MIRAECDLKKISNFEDIFQSRRNYWGAEEGREGLDTHFKENYYNNIEISNLVSLNVNLWSGVSDYLIYTSKWVKQNIQDNSLHGKSSDYLNTGIDQHRNYFIHNPWHQAGKGEKHWTYHHLTKFILESHMTSNIDLPFLIPWDLFPSLVTICVVVWKRQLLQPASRSVRKDNL